MASRTEANGDTRIVHYLDLKELGLEDVLENTKLLAAREASDFIKNQILREVSNGESPIAGEGRFKRLDVDYAKKEKGGRRISDLELEGDLKDSLISEPSRDGFIKLGHEGGEVPKADGHNQLSAKAKAWATQKDFPRRRYIPDDNQKFNNTILSGVKGIIDGHKRAPVRERQDSDASTFASDDSVTTPVTVSNTSDIFSDDVIDDLLNDAFSRRGAF